MAKRKGREYWLAAVRRFENGQMSQPAFCSRHKLNIGTFRGWLYRLRGEGVSLDLKKSKRQKLAKFLEVQPAASHQSTGTLCTLRVGQVEVDFHGQPSALFLSEVASCLRSACS